MVRLDLQIIGPQLNRYMSIAQVVGGTGQVKRRSVRGASCDAQHRLRCSFDADQGAVFGHQDITSAHHSAAWQEYAHTAPPRVCGFEAAFLPDIPIQGQCGSAFHEDRSQASTLGNQFGSLQHQNKKYL